MASSMEKATPHLEEVEENDMIRKMSRENAKKGIPSGELTPHRAFFALIGSYTRNRFYQENLTSEVAKGERYRRRIYQKL
jgi:hypothetical protein